MKPSEIYSRVPEKISQDVYEIQNHIPEANLDLYMYDTEETTQDEVEIRYYKYYNFDGRRIWKVAGVYFEGNPVMIFQNAGREGDDAFNRFITDVDNYKDMCNYLNSIYGQMPHEKDIVDIEEEIPHLANFYDCHIDGKFEPYEVFGLSLE